MKYVLPLKALSALDSMRALQSTALSVTSVGISYKFCPLRKTELTLLLLYMCVNSFISSNIESHSSVDFALIWGKKMQHSLSGVTISKINFDLIN